MKVYTKKGDQGYTVIGGSSVPKSDDLIITLSSVDKLNAEIGVVASMLGETSTYYEALLRVQSNLMTINSYLAGYISDLKIIDTAIGVLESEIDDIEELNEPLNNFILPTGNQIASFFHLARAETRLLETKLVHLQLTRNSVHPVILTYINRLSDYLFVLGRLLNNQGTNDIKWV